MTLSSIQGYYDPIGGLRPARLPRALPQGAETAQPIEGVAVSIGDTGTDARQQFHSPGTKLIAETSEEESDGTFRRSRTFEQPDGRRFTKMEEYTVTDRGTRRAVVQENPSGTVTKYEETLDRQDAGGFRRTQRFQEGVAGVETVITPDFAVSDPYVLSRGQISPLYGYPLPFQSTRGMQLDMRA